MASPQHEKVFGVFYLVREAQTDRFRTHVNIITKEQIIGFLWEPAHLEPTQEIVILSSNISNDLLLHHQERLGSHIIGVYLP